jgi:xanthine dehydrogenase accessory factor
MGQVLQKERGQVVELELDEGHLERLGFAPGETAEVFVEPFLPPPVLYVFGGGHVGHQIGRLAKNVGFRMVIVDDRPAFANPQRHPEADECLVAEMEGVFEQLPIDGQSYIVAATRGHQHDEVVVEQAIRTPARYIGMLGSERKKMVLWKRIEKRGGDRKKLERVYAPIGMNIGADTPEEIAVSVVAELIRVRRGVKKPWKTKRTGEGS